MRKFTNLFIFVLMSFGMLFSTLELTGCASTPKQEGTQQFVDSSAITLKIKTSLLADPDIKSLPISVDTFKSRVTLSGYVDNAYQKQKAVDIARQTSGVRSVNDRLIIRR